MKRFKLFLIALLVIVTVSMAASYYTLFITTRLQLNSGAVAFFDGSSYLALGDSAYISAGGKIADTSSFSTTLLTKAIYIPGAEPTDVYFVSFRSLASGVSTAALADSSTLGYFAKTDSVIVQRSGAGVVASGSKFSWIRAKLR